MTARTARPDQGRAVHDALTEQRMTNTTRATATSAPQARETSDVQRYLHALHGRASTGALIEVRYRHPKGMRQAFLARDDTHAAARTIVRLGISTDVYVGVAPRRRRGGGKDAIDRLWTLWADLDDPTAHHQLQRLPVAPAIVIASAVIRSDRSRSGCGWAVRCWRHVVSEADRIARGGIRVGR